MADKDKENVRENLERGREDLEQGINSAFLTEEIPADSIDAGTLPTGDPVIIDAPPVYSRPSAADRMERIINRPDGQMLPSLADRAERQAFVQRARSQAELRPSLADRAEREVNLRLEQLLDPQERVKYSPAAVAQLNARLEAARKAKEEPPVTGEEQEQPLAGGMFGVDTGLNDFIEEQRAQQTVSQPPVEALRGETERKSFVLENYPTLIAAAERSGLSDDEVRDMVNFTLAFDAASIVGNPTVMPERKAAILATMSVPMQSLVVDIVNAGIQEDMARGEQPDYAGRVAEAQEQGREVVREATAGVVPAGEYIGGAISKALEQQQIIGEQSTGNTGQDILRTAWNWTLGPAFDAWFAGAENIQRQVRAGMLVTGTQLGDYSWEEAWKAAEKGQFSQQRLDELREMYGQKPVDLIVEVMDASKSNDPDFIGTIIQKYQDDPEMLDYLDKAINGTRNDQEFANLITSVRAAETGDIGNVAMQSKMELLFPGSGLDISREKPIGLEGYEQTRGYFIGRNTVNVLALFFLDPLLALGVARGGVLAARYGMARVALEANAPVKGTRVFQEPAVRRFMGTLGGQLNDLNRLEATEGVAAMSPVSQSLRSMYKRYFTPEALDDMRIYMRSQAKPDSDPATVLEEYFSNIENIQHIIVGQSARRGRQVQVPHMTAATARVKLMSLKARGLTYPSVQSSQFLDEVFYPGFSQRLPEEAGDDLARILSGEGGDQYVGRALSDFTIRDGDMVRNLMGRVVLDRLPKSWGFTRRYGWRRSHTPAAIAARARRLAAIWPNTAKPLKVSDASDAGRVQQLVEAAGMPRHFGQIMREVWVASDEATRRMIGEGLARTYGYARGVDVVSDEGRRLIDEIGPGAGRGDQYAASMPNMVELEGQAMRLAQQRIDEAGITGKVDQTVLDQYALLYDDVVRESEEIAKIEGKTLEEMGLGAGDNLASKVLDRRAQTLLDENPELLDAGIFRSPSGLVIDTSNSKIKSLYLKKFYPNLQPSTRITLYRAVQEGEVPGTVRGTTGPAGGRIEPGAGSWWTTNPMVAARFAETGEGRKIAVLNVSWDELQKIDSTFVPGPRAGGYGLDDEVIIDFTSDAFKSVADRVSILDEFNVPSPSNLNAIAAIKQISLKKPSADSKSLANEILKTELLPKAGKYNPSMVDGRPGAITLSDMTDSMTFPDINRLEPVTARSSLLTALTGQNIGMSNVTDFWVLGTLAGPRFQVRNAIEDMGLFLATGGSFRQYLQGRMFSTGRREATERPRKTEFAEPKGMKLGTFKTLSRSIGNITGKLYADETAAIVLPNLSKQDIARANNLAREGNREALAKLVAKAYLRQRLRLLPGEFRVIGRTVDEKKLKPKELERLRWLEQAIEHGDVLKAMDEAAETGRHLADGFPARVDDMNDPMGIDLARNGDVVRINGQDFRIYENVTEYRDIPVHNTSNDSIKAWHHNVSKILHGDGPKGQWTMQLLPRYYRAVRGGRDSEIEEIVTELAERVAGADEAWGYGTRSMIQRAGGFEALARASLDNALQLFTTRNGRFNRPLFRKTQVKAVREDGTEYTKYAMWDLDEAGERVHLVSQTDLAQFSIDGVAPMMVNAPATQKIAIPMQNKWSSRAWAAMGRSLARMTREPIFTANYLDSREVLSPFEKIIARDIGEEAAQRWAVNAATERTFRLTMNYVDNPNIRSQFAWQVRNVARFYRALEDFNRRMIRTTRNEPMAFAKIALAWNALDDSGFVWEDEFGEKYFVWPGTRQGFEYVNGIFNMLGAGQVYSPSLPLAFTSRVNMTTPSADPNALLPTFSGPYASFAVLPAMKVLPGLKNLEDEFFGEYTKGRSVWETAFPSHIVRAFNFMRSQVGTTESRLNETDTVFATAARSAAVAYAAAGLWEPGVNYTDEEIALHRQRVDRTAQWIVGLKFLFAPVAFAALSLNVDTATDFAKSFGLDGMRPAFVQLLRKNEGDISAASIQWIKLNPDLSPFMVGTTGTPDSAGYYGPFEEVVRWIEDNEDAVELSPAGASFFAPIDGKQTLASWSFLAANGFKSRDSVDTYIKELMNAEGKSIYYALRSQWVDEKKAGVSGADGRWEDAKNQLFATYPRLKSALGGEQATGGRSSISDMQAEVDSIREVANFLKDNNRLDERGENIYNLVRLRDQSHSRLSKIDPYSSNADEETTEIREAWKKVLSDAGSLYPEDRQFRNLLYILSESLVENWGRYV